MIQWYGMVMQTPSKTWSSRGKDKRLAHSIPCENFGMGIESREWFFIVHPPYFNCEQCAQIIKRNVSISLHSISAIRWHYCRTRTASFHFEQHFRHSGLIFSHYVSFRSLCVVLLSIFFSLYYFIHRCFDSINALYRNTEQQIEHKQQSVLPRQKISRQSDKMAKGWQ